MHRKTIRKGCSYRGGWNVAELWTVADRLFAVFGLVAAEPAQSS
jgi:hypothetical protein